MNTPCTPRDILLARHAASRPALDAQRGALLARFATAPAHHRHRDTSSFRDILSVLHRELFAPYRRVWSALACVWLAILAFQQFDRLAAPPFAPSRRADVDSAADAALLALWLEQRRQLAALGGDTGPRPAAPREILPPPAVPGPLGFAAPASLRIAIA